MSRLRVKICGLTRLEDARLAADLGADAVGFVFWPKSPRHISPSAAREIGDALPPFVTRVGVFVNAAPDEVARAVRAARLDVVQLHGDEDIERYRDLPARLVRAAALRTAVDLEAAKAWPAEVMPLVDAADREERGGTGRRADWDLAAALALTRPIILAGGLTAETLQSAVDRVAPWAVDVSSGVEVAPGVKSPDRLRALFAAAHHLTADPARDR